MKKIITRAFIVTLIVSISWLAWANPVWLHLTPSILSQEQTELKDSQETKETRITESEQKIIKELQDAFAGVQSGRLFLVGGNLVWEDPSDSSQRRQASAFVYGYDGASLYSKNGAQEAVNTPEYYAVIDHELNKIVVAPSKKREERELIPLKLLGKNLKGEGYHITRHEEGGVVDIRLLCENHISCKEIRVRLDAATKKPAILAYRFTDLDHADDPAFDKRFSVTFTTWQIDPESAKTSFFPYPVAIGQNGIEKMPGYESYEIINLITQ